MQQLQPMDPQRGREGYWTHPYFPQPKDGNEFFLPGEFDAWLEAQGMVSSVVFMESDPDAEDVNERYGNGDCDILAWQPKSPDGDGWFLVSIHQTEDDGPVAVWFRPKVEIVETNLDELKQAFIESHKVCERAAYDYFAALPVGDERTRMGGIYQRIRLATSRSGKGA